MSTFFPIVELVDRLVIAKIKLEKTQSNRDEYDFYVAQLSQCDLSLVADLINQLELIHLTIWKLESDIRRGFEDKLGLEEVGKRAIEIRNHNAQRIILKNQIAEKLGCPIREIKQDHLSC
jgi:hypothetical protein